LSTGPASARSSQERAGTATVVLVLGGYAVAVLVLLLTLEHRPASRATVEAAAPANAAAFPAPLPRAVVFSRESERNALALAVAPRKGALVVQASIVGPDGVGVVGVPTTFALGGTEVVAGSACGAGCYRAVLPIRGRPRAVELVAGGDVATRWQVMLPTPWPPHDASELMAGARRTWRALRSMFFHDRLASDNDHVVTSSWLVHAPDRLAYRIDGGASAVIIGKHRWDKQPGAAWKRSPQLPITQPTPPWVSATNAYVVGSANVRGRPVWNVTFFDPKTPAWFTVSVDRETRRTLDLRMVAAAHFMHEVYGSFDAAPAIRAPRRD
jgi:hypothetical protein